MQVAANSAADEKVGELIADAMEKVGKDGVITVEESKTMDTNLSIVEGMQFDRGYASAYERRQDGSGARQSAYSYHRQEDQQYSGDSSRSRTDRQSGRETPSYRGRLRERVSRDLGREQTSRNVQLRCG